MKSRYRDDIKSENRHIQSVAIRNKNQAQPWRVAPIHIAAKMGREAEYIRSRMATRSTPYSVIESCPPSLAQHSPATQPSGNWDRRLAEIQQWRSAYLPLCTLTQWRRAGCRWMKRDFPREMRLIILLLVYGICRELQMHKYIYILLMHSA